MYLPFNHSFRGPDSDKQSEFFFYSTKRALLVMDIESAANIGAHILASNIDNTCKTHALLVPMVLTALVQIDKADSFKQVRPVIDDLLKGIHLMGEAVRQDLREELPDNLPDYVPEYIAWEPEPGDYLEGGA